MGNARSGRGVVSLGVLRPLEMAHTKCRQWNEAVKFLVQISLSRFLRREECLAAVTVCKASTGPLRSPPYGQR